MSEEYDSKIVAEHWSMADCSASDRNFYCFPAIRNRSCRLIFGETDASRKDWCEYWTIEKYLKPLVPVGRCLSICCGFGEVERTLARLGAAERITGIDIAPGAIEQARVRADREGFHNIEYRVCDVNKEELPEAEYDLIWANGALHHIRDIELVVGRLSRALKPGGLLVSNEYVGPDYQQLSVRQQEIINAVKHLLPRELRTPLTGPPDAPGPSLGAKVKDLLGRVVNSYKLRDDVVYEKLWDMPSVAWFRKTDPSECVRSSAIVPVLKEHFAEVDVRYFNGSIIFYALDQAFYQNYDPGSAAHRRLLEMIFALEEHYVACGEFQQDNAHIICRKVQ
ncbi:class I SAM-dependent methyltransferase [Geomonas propionica]|uniref:Class I SAM-dependent methyltransferase n=1 Tax=Geomonas propionica TaxID=2798582 RepID=A0ABS0YMT9_9BACT|nr:class I SAM-dependent methyltransferase [Geomonas propionica]MBJ6799243.1 class I SAM-dependent methyltransferase [Geomonas propionica]